MRPEARTATNLMEGAWTKEWWPSARPRGKRGASSGLGRVRKRMEKNLEEEFMLCHHLLQKGTRGFEVDPSDRPRAEPTYPAAEKERPKRPVRRPKTGSGASLGSTRGERVKMT